MTTRSHNDDSQSRSPSIRLLKAGLVLAVVGTLVGCSDSSDTKQPDPEPVQTNADTSYLDSLAEEQGLDIEEDRPNPETQSIAVVDDQGNEDPIQPTEVEEEEDREWVAEEGSQSLFGRSRDKAMGLRDQIQGGTSAENGLAYTLSDEEYASKSGLRWEMPEDWRMSVPGADRFAEMYIQHQLGNASVSFSKESDTVHRIIRDLQSQIIDTMGGRSKAQTRKETIQGRQVTFVDLDGTYIDPGAKGGSNEQIFYAIHAAIFEMDDHRIMVKMWGPQDTVNFNIRTFDTMISETSTN